MIPTKPQPLRQAAPQPTPAEGENLNHWYQKLFRRALYLTGDHGLAEDAAQETFYRYLSRRPAGLANPGAWLITVCTRLCYDWLRRRGRNPAAPFDENLSVADPGPLPEEVLTDREDLVLVRQALDSLAPRDRLILLLRYSSTSYREIAGTIGCAESSVGQLLHRAEGRFKAAYEHLVKHGSPR